MRDLTMLVRERCLALLTAAILASPLAVGPLAAQERTFRPLRSLGGGSELTASVSLGDVNGDGRSTWSSPTAATGPSRTGST